MFKDAEYQPCRAPTETRTCRTSAPSTCRSPRSPLSPWGSRSDPESRWMAQSFWDRVQQSPARCSMVQTWGERSVKRQLLLTPHAARSHEAHLLSYSRLDTILMKVLGLIWRPSFSSYRFSLNFNLWALNTNLSQNHVHRKKRKVLPVEEDAHTVWTSVAKPASPMYSRSPIGKIFWKSVVTIWAWMPNLRSAAIATQFFPRMAMTAPPLYDIIDWKRKKKLRSEERTGLFYGPVSKSQGSVPKK